VWPHQTRTRFDNERVTMLSTSIQGSVRGAERPGNGDHARAVALRALGFVFGDRAYLDRFLCSVTISLSDLRRQPSSPANLAAVLDFIIDNELILLRFSRTIDLSVEAVYEARRLLGGEMIGRGRKGNWRLAASTFPSARATPGSTS